MARREIYINSASNPWCYPWDDKSIYTSGWVHYDGNINYLAGNSVVTYPMHVATKFNGKWTACYKWDRSKGKFVCTRYRDVLRKQKKAALLASLKQDLAIAQSSDPVSA